MDILKRDFSAMTIGHFDEISQEFMFADTNVQLILIGSSGYNFQYKPFCDWLTLIDRKHHPSKVSAFPINCASVSVRIFLIFFI